MKMNSVAQNFFKDRNCWTYMPGTKISEWQFDLEDGVMAFGQNEIGDLCMFKGGLDDLSRLLKKRYDDAAKGNATYLLYARDVVKPGDLVFVKSGLHCIIGFGLVVGRYRYDVRRGRNKYRHTVPVRWLVHDIEIDVRSLGFSMNRTSLTRFDKSKATLVLKAIGIDSRGLAAGAILPGESVRKAPSEVFDPVIRAEDRRVTAVSRGGQSQYRAALMRRWGGQCAVTGIDEITVLRASHMKPFSKCSKKERYDVNNGLILAAHIDALFDSGLITFTPGGVMRISKSLSSASRKALRLSGRLRAPLNLAQKSYLGWHRNNVFVG